MTFRHVGDALSVGPIVPVRPVAHQAIDVRVGTSDCGGNKQEIQEE